MTSRRPPLRPWFGAQPFAILCLMLCFSSLIPEAAWAQGADAGTAPELFAWAQATPPDWARGALYAALGIVGALFIMFTLVGGAVPGTAGQARIDADVLRLERLSQRLEEIISSPMPDPALVREIGHAVDVFRDDLRAEQRRQYAIAAVLYTILGAFFASLLAKDLLQALVIGAGWTSVVGSLGLKKDHSERAAMKNDAMEKAQQVLSSEAQRSRGDSGRESVDSAARGESLKSIMDDLELARKL